MIAHLGQRKISMLIPSFLRQEPRFGHTGVAFETRLASYSSPNRTLAFGGLLFLLLVLPNGESNSSATVAMKRLVLNMFKANMCFFGIIGAELAPIFVMQ